MKDRIRSVINAMLAMQRYPWEQGVCAQALYEAGCTELWVPMARDAVMRRSGDGRLAMISGEAAVSDPASAGTVCLKAWEMTGDPFFEAGARGMLEYLEQRAPRTRDGIICHNNISFEDGYSPLQLWIDGAYMVPPFLAAMGRVEEAAEQLRGYCRYLLDPETDLFFHIRDTADGRFVREKHWATGNGWALMGLARVAGEAGKRNLTAIRDEMNAMGNRVLKAMVSLSLPDGRFHDILDDPESFTDGTSAMMAAAAVWRRVTEGTLPEAGRYTEWAERAYRSVLETVDEWGLVHQVAGCPDFVSQGTSAEAQAALIMADAWREKAMQAQRKMGNDE